MEKKANGTFLWVSLVIEQLKHVESWDVEEVVDEMPAGLTKLYRRMFEQINTLERGTPKMCQLVLTAATISHQPLHLRESVETIVKLCYSFLTIRDQNVYIIHQSAKDFLTELFKKSPTGIAAAHHAMSSTSLQLMSQTLCRNIYGLSDLGVANPVMPLRQDPLAGLGYSCIYWADHACDASVDRKYDELSDDGLVFNFLKSRFLHWLESFSLLGKFPRGAASVKTLLDRVELQAFLKDAERFAVGYRSIMERAPLHIYGAALVFCPTDSQVKKYFWEQRYPMMPTVRGIQDGWDSCLQILEGHTGPFNAVALSERRVRLWNSTTGSHKRTLESHSDWVAAVAFFPDGKTLASASGDRTVPIWNHTTDDRHVLHGHGDSVNALAFSCNGKTLASASSDRTIRPWDLGTRSCQAVLEGHENPIAGICFSPRDGVLTLASGDGQIRFWDLHSNDNRTFGGDHHWVNAIAFSPDGETLALASSDHTIGLWDVATRICKRVLEGHGDSVNTIVFASGDKVKSIMSASSDRTLRFWDISGEAGTEHTAFERHRDSATALAFTSHDNALASASDDGTIRLWDSTTGNYRRTLEGHERSVLPMDFSPDGQSLASASEDRTIRLWNIADNTSKPPQTYEGIHVKTFEGHRNDVRAISFSSDGEMVSAVSEDGTRLSWDVTTKEKNEKISLAQTPISIAPQRFETHEEM
ncbi:quinon protein alcohol dehydrogenase-like superfamily [Immersiella caudata]|uniref:Quinon protein alcohol dehydrogenase-like superfamily n=1 Tax=Immersiella caudata TaxID=314043 RepID=A0AA40C374_9PEZI|nr:quinon protein alcohol dehydrogenase-like superfamily [Immersiella caudata]